MQVAVGGVPLLLELRSGVFGTETLGRYRSFLARSPGAGESGYRLLLNPSARKVSNAPWLPDVSLARNYLSCVSSDFRWRLPLDGGVGGGRFKDSPQALDSVLRSVFASLLPMRSGIFLHAATLAYRGKAYLFAGPSGAGKTTLARRLRGVPGVTVLSDELSLLRRNAGGFRAYATPFWGEFRRPAIALETDRKGGVSLPAAPIEKVFCLVKSSGGPRTAPLSARQAHSKLLKCLICFSTNAALVRKSWDLLASVIERYPVEELRWDRRDPAGAVLDVVAGGNRT